MVISDAELLRDYVQCRSEDASRAIVGRYSGLVYSISRRMIGDIHDAEDAVQRVFMALFQNARRLTSGPVGGYLATLAFATSRRVRRARWIIRKAEISFEQAMDANEDGFFKAISSAPRPGSTQNALEAMGRGLERMPEGFREALALFHLEGLSVQAVARALNISDAAASKRLVEARKRMRELMAREGYAAPATSIGIMLSQLKLSAPLHLQDQIIKAATSLPRTPSARAPRRVTPLRAASGVAAAAVLASVLAVALLPKSRQVQVVAASPPKAAAATPAAVSPPVPVSHTTVQDMLARNMREYTENSTPFNHVLWIYGLISGIDLQPQWDKIEAAGVRPDSPLNGDFSPSSAADRLQSILDTVAKPGTLEYLIVDDHIVIRPRAAIASNKAAGQ